MIHKPNLKFHKHIFQENKKSRIVIISWAWIYTKNSSDSNKFYMKSEKIISQSTAFWAVKIKFSCPLAELFPGPAVGRGITAPPDPSCIQHTNFFTSS